MEKIHPKLHFVNNHILVQLSTLERIREYLTVQTDACKTCIKDHETKLQTLSIELANIFDLLRQCTVDTDIVSLNNEHDKTMVSPVTLFDYISDQAIIELQRQADDEIGDIETISNALDNQTKTLSNTIAELASSRDNTLSLSLDEPIFSFTNQKLQAQEAEIEKMADILTSLTNHYDQLGEATRIYQSEKEMFEEIDITVLQDDHEHMPSILDDLRDSLDSVEAINNEIETRMNIYRKIQQELIQLLSQLEQFGSGQADTICDRIVAAEAEIKQHEGNLDSFFKELSNLAEWYRLYASSYNHLLLEIERRRYAQEKQARLQRELTKSFQDSYEDELQERHAWFTQHGQYLPEDLCPFIMDPPSKLLVQLETEQSRLPKLSQSSVKRALAEVHNTIDTNSHQG
ncbi:hypothetical protein K501DRAFT_288447 [Backusella circina FSU 941]|nr:hypothetical protein K501DRAFT_288447 [Backusella circina FSU 941]